MNWGVVVEWCILLGGLISATSLGWTFGSKKVEQKLLLEQAKYRHALRALLKEQRDLEHTPWKPCSRKSPPT